MASLKKVGDELHLDLKGHPDFRHALGMAKRIPGKNFDPETKIWKYPAKVQTAMRIVHTVQPQPDATILGWMRAAAAEIADDLTSQLPDKAELLWKPPAGLKLFDFQEPAIDFLANTKRTLLADDMGLGKTIESIGAVEEWTLREMVDLDRGPILVVAGTSKLGDWRDEYQAWAPDRPVVTVPGDKTPKKRLAMLKDFERNEAKAGGVLVVNHEQLRAENVSEKKRGKGDWQLKQPWFGEQQWLAAIADEAHRFKNRDAQQTRGLWQIDAHLRYALTGTAIINSPDEVWAILAWLRPDTYEEWSSTKVTYWQFFNAYVESYDIEGRGTVITGVKNSDDLRFELTDKMARRTKKLLRDRGLLPGKLPTRTRVVPMRPAQRRLYAEAEDDLWISIEQDLEALDPEQRAKLEALLGDGFDPNNPALLRLLPNSAAKYAALKQIATSPALLGAKDESGKLDAVIEEITDNPEKPFVVFCWHKRAVGAMLLRLEKKRIKAEGMTGDTAQLERTEVVRRFQEGETQILVATIKTGGEGLNLTRADACLFVEQSDRLTDNDQAIDRLDRLGQKSVVSSIVFQSENTVETNNQAARLRMKELIIGSSIGRDLPVEEK